MRLRRPLHEVFRELRDEQGLSVTPLAAALGERRETVSRFLSGARVPSRGQLDRLCAVLGVRPDEVLAATDWRPARPGRPASPLEPRIERFFGGDRPFEPRGSRPYEASLKACFKFYGHRARALEREIDGRPDLPEIERFLPRVAVDSGAEVFYHLVLLALGARPAWLAPLALGCGDPRIQDRALGEYVGHRRMPALVLETRNLTAVLIPQVPLETEEGPVRLDALACLSDGRSRAVADVEVDGGGHDFTRNADRDRAVRLPIVRYTERCLARRDLKTLVVEDLRTRFEQFGRRLTRRLR